MRKYHLGNPPFLAMLLLKYLSRYNNQHSILKDSEYTFAEVLTHSGVIKAKLWYWKNAIQSLREYLQLEVYRNIIMFKSYVKLALKNTIRQKTYSALNIMGLAVGLTCAILILFYVHFEFSFDRYHKNVANIYRVVMLQKGNFFNGNEWFNATPGALQKAAPETFPEVLKATRAHRVWGLIRHKGNVFAESHIRYVDPEFLEIFSFPLVHGNPLTALSDPFSLLISEEMATKYFGTTYPVGEILNLDSYDYTITGIVKNVPANSHFTFDFLASFNTLFTVRPGNASRYDSWGGAGVWNIYLLTSENAQISELEKKLTDQLRSNRRASAEDRLGEDSRDELALQPLVDIHLYSDVNMDAPNVSDIRYVYLFSAIALFILLVAVLNYVNLSTARAAKRAKEVGIRKVVGAYRSNLVKQFLGESSLFVCLAFLISIVLTHLILPSFSSFINRELSFSIISNAGIILGLIGVLVFVALLSGSYPAFFLSAFKPVQTVKGVSGSSTKGSHKFRSSLLVIQFIISTFLIVCSLTTYSQLNFLKSSKLGFNKDHIIYSFLFDGISENFQAVKGDLRKSPDIVDFYGAGDIPITMNTSVYPEWENKQEGENIYFYMGRVKHNFVEFFEVEIVLGRNFSRDFGTDEEAAYILNETAVKAIGWEDPIGKAFSTNEENGKVIGVVRDFHFSSLHQKIAPMALKLISRQRMGEYYAVKVRSGRLPETLVYFEQIFKKYEPETPFAYSFLDERVNRMYQAEEKLGEIFLIFTSIAIFISCLGLFGLVLYTTEQKTREIGIRKVLGASDGTVIKLISKEFLWLAILANIIATPLAYFAMNTWLQNFAYRIKLDFSLFTAAAVLTIIIALVTMGYQSISAARANPVDSLRYE